MQEFPIFFGVDHDNNNLIKEMEKLLEKYGVKGTRLFIEMTPNYLAKTLKGGKTEGPFEKVVLEARRRGIEIMPLDKQSITNVTDKASIDFYEAYKYLIYNVREKHWKRVIQQNARKSDMVIMHPGHLKRIQKALRIPENQITYFPASPKSWLKPLNAKALKQLKLKRTKLRQQRQQAGRAKRKPK